MGAQVVVEDGRHVVVERGHHVAAALDHGDRKAALRQVLGHLQSDEPAAHHGGAARGGLPDEVGDGERAFHCTQGEQVLDVGPRDWWHDGQGPGCEDELVVGFEVGRAVVEPAHRHGFGGAVDGDDLLMGARIDAEAPPEAVGSLQGEPRAVPDDAAHVVGQPAVRVAHVPRALDDHDLRLLVQATQARGRRRSACDPADDDHLHVALLPCRPHLRFRAAGQLSIRPSFGTIACRR